MRELRASSQDVPVVMLTALRGDALVQAALDLGADDYVTKPFSNTVLVARIGAASRAASCSKVSIPRPVHSASRTCCAPAAAIATANPDE